MNRPGRPQVFLVAADQTKHLLSMPTFYLAVSLRLDAITVLPHSLFSAWLVAH